MQEFPALEIQCIRQAKFLQPYIYAMKKFLASLQWTFGLKMLVEHPVFCLHMAQQ
jgi:formylmethanofuran dehydrogenase subunit A